MTMFNVRLGAWLPNPAVAREKELRFGKPRNSQLAIFAELFGMATDSRESVYLSDGGHFDNLGVYEMLRRRCSHILVVDAGADPKCVLADLGSVMRRAAIDGLAVIEMDPMRILSREDLAKLDPAERALDVATGTIRYPGNRMGRLVYIKPTFLADIPADIHAYGIANPTFPHESTADQWFTESQFESYRALGEWQMARLIEQTPENAGENDVARVEALFAAACKLAKSESAVTG